MKKIGILCASDTELAPFLTRMHIEKVTEKAMLKFYEGTFGTVSYHLVAADYLRFLPKIICESEKNSGNIQGNLIQ